MNRDESFFHREPPSAEEQPKRPPRPVWLGPPPNVVGTVVALDPPLFLARSEETAVVINELTAYPQGFEVALSVHFRSEEHPQRMHTFMGLEPGWMRAGGEIPPETLRFGVEFSDGRKATNLDGRPRWDPTQPSQMPPSPVLFPQGGGGGGVFWNQRFWVWGLPPLGSLDFVCEWPGCGFPLTRLRIDASTVLVAAARAIELWPEE